MAAVGARGGGGSLTCLTGRASGRAWRAWRDGTGRRTASRRAMRDARSSDRAGPSNTMPGRGLSVQRMQRGSPGRRGLTSSAACRLSPARTSQRRSRRQTARGALVSSVCGPVGARSRPSDVRPARAARAARRDAEGSPSAAGALALLPPTRPSSSYEAYEDAHTHTGTEPLATARDEVPARDARLASPPAYPRTGAQARTEPAAAGQPDSRRAGRVPNSRGCWCRLPSAL